MVLGPLLEALFGFMGSRKEKFVLVLDEYQDIRKLEKENVDAMLRNAMEELPENIHIIISGSSIRVMEALTRNDNPLYGRFKTMIFVGEMDYYDSEWSLHPVLYVPMCQEWISFPERICI